MDAFFLMPCLPLSDQKHLNWNFSKSRNYIVTLQVICVKHMLASFPIACLPFSLPNHVFCVISLPTKGAPLICLSIKTILVVQATWKDFSPKLVAALVDRGSIFKLKQELHRSSGFLNVVLNFYLMAFVSVRFSLLQQ